MDQKKIFLRAVEPGDMDLLYRWANDTNVRQNSFQTAPIPYEDHEKWLKLHLNDDTCIFYILMVDDKPIGQIRLTTVGGFAEINYSIDTLWRGKGYGGEMIRLVVEEVKRNYPSIKILTAKVKPGNIPSAKCFENNNFVKAFEEFKLELG